MPTTIVKPGLSPKFLRVDPDDLLFDEQNPRFGGTKFKGNIQGSIQEHLFARPYFASELVDSFLQNGFIEYEPLIVRPALNNKWIIVEGNRRLAAIRHILNNPGKYPAEAIAKLRAIPVITFPDTPTGPDSNAIRVYLGVRHLFGFREWPPFSKARFLDSEIKREGLQKIVDEMRLAKDTIRRLVLPFRLLEKANVQLAPNEDFWVLAESLSSTGTKKFIELVTDPSDLEVKSFSKPKFSELIELLYGRKSAQSARDSSTKVITETREIKILAKVLESDKAYKVLQKTRSLDDAAIMVDTKAEGLKRLGRLAKTVPRVANQVTEGIKSNDAVALKAAASDFGKAANRFLGPKRLNA